MADPTIVQAGKYQIAKVRFRGREDRVGIREGAGLPWAVLGEVSDVLGMLKSFEDVYEWVETRRNLIPRPVPIDVNDWYFSGGTRALDSVFVRRPGVPTLRRTLTAASSSLIANATMLPPGLVDMSDAPPVISGGAYTISAYASASIAGFRSVIALTWVGASGDIIGSSAGDYVTGGVVGAWQRPYVTVEAPVDAAFVLPAVTISTGSGNAPNGTQAWVTDGLMEVGSTVGEFIAPGVAPDTDTHRIAWTGAPNESASVEELLKLVSVGEESGKWIDEYGHIRIHSSVKGADSRGLLDPEQSSNLPRDLFSGLGGVGFDIRTDSVGDREALRSAVESLDFGSMVSFDADSSELSKGVDYGRA